jgi:hypothetical protein
MAHRLNLWARTGDGNRAHKLYADLLSNGTLPNLWDTHPPFQIDGNFGGTAGVAEMLLQSHAGTIDILPALPDCWADGSFSGLVARGNFNISAVWKNKKLSEITIVAKAGGECKLKLPGYNITVTGKDHQPVRFERSCDDIISLFTNKDDTIKIILK